MTVTGQYIIKVKKNVSLVDTPNFKERLKGRMCIYFYYYIKDIGVSSPQTVNLSV